MNNCLKNELDLRVESRLEWNEILNSEVNALKKLQRLGHETRNYVPTLIRQEIERRKAFLQELLINF